jgi:hypothetical protein
MFSANKAQSRNHAMKQMHFQPRDIMPVQHKNGRILPSRL